MVADEKQQGQRAKYEGIDLARAIELLSEKDSELTLVLHRLRQLEKMLYGPRSNKRTEPVDPSLLLPFPGLQELLDSAVARAGQRAAEKKAAEASKPANSKTSKRRGPRSLSDDIPDDVPRHRREKKLAPDQCGCGCGGKLIEVREEVSRRWEQIKMLDVDERVTTYYACRKCEKMISVAPTRTSSSRAAAWGPA